MYVNHFAAVQNYYEVMREKINKKYNEKKCSSNRTYYMYSGNCIIFSLANRILGFFFNKNRIYFFRIQFLPREHDDESFIVIVFYAF